MEEKVNRIVLVEDIRIAFAPGIFEASAFDAKSTPLFSAKFIIPQDHPEAKKLVDLEMEVATAKWGGDAPSVLKKAHLDNDTRLLRDGDSQNAAGFEGNFYIAPVNEERPSVFAKDRTPVVKSDGVVYSGCKVNVRIEVWPQDNKWGKCVRAKLLGVQFVAEGDAFGSGAKAAAADDFPDLDAGDAVDPFA